MILSEALEIISEDLYDTSEELSDGLPEGSNSEWGYDSQLAVEIAEAVIRWNHRKKSVIKDPYVIWKYQDGKFQKDSIEMYQEDAYREWYRLTGGNRRNHNSDFEVYYILESAKWNQEVEAEEADDFSVRYLLNKSFGD